MRAALFDDQGRAGREANKAIRGAADDPLIKGGMPHEADDQKIGLYRLDPFDNRRHRMAGDDFGVVLNSFRLGHGTRLLAAFRSVVGDHDVLEHLRPPASPYQSWA